MLTSPVRALKQEFPKFRIAVLAESRFTGCFDANPDFDEVIPADGKLSTARRLLRKRFDAVVNLHGGPTSFAFSCFAGGKRIGAEHYQYARFYSGLVPPPDSAVHTVESTMATFQWLGVRAVSPPALRYEFHPAEAARIDERFKGRPYALIHPAALMSTKRWDAARFAEVGKKLADRNLTIVVTSGPGEQAYAAEVARSIPGTVIMLGLSIPELAELIRAARIYVGNDSGPMHLAAAVNTPAVAVWGSSDSRRWRPWAVPHRVVQNPFECNPCPGYRCLVSDSPLCIESVTVDQVSAAAMELLEK